MAIQGRILAVLLTVSLLIGLPTLSLASESGTCSETQRCKSGCCSTSGYCGFGPDYCGDTCISDCDAVAECGTYAATPGAACPLNVCCSQYGFCGTTEKFCGDGCQNGCSKPQNPGCRQGFGSADRKRIGYFESWSNKRACNAWEPFMIDASKWTHLNYAFALIDPATFHIGQMNDFDTELYPQVTGLKSRSPGLKVYISVGGWAAGGKVFSDMAATQENRAAFIQSAISFMKTYVFDGIDIDWEYPVADDRGGDPDDFTNFVLLLSELRAVLGNEYGITVTLPSSYWYLQGFDIVSLEPYVNWFNIMTYDIHGTWDGNSPYTSAVVQAHTNLTEIDDGLDLLWRNEIPPSKVVLGLAFYGRSFTLADSSCTAPGCPFSAGGRPGQCTDTSGILSYQEVEDIISEHDLQPILDEKAGVKYMSWNEDQWVSYDDSETFAMKLDYANSRCLGGTMVWALDLDSAGENKAIDSLLHGSSNLPIDMRKTLQEENSLSLAIFWTPCLPHGSQSCPPGYHELASGHGKVFDADLNHLSGKGCHGGGRHGFNRVLCAENTVNAYCRWGPGAKSKRCNSKCPKGWITLTKNSHIGGQDKGCKGGRYAPLCCEYVVWHNSQSDVCYSDMFNQIIGGGDGLQDAPDVTRRFLWLSDSDNDQSLVNRAGIDAGDDMGSAMTNTMVNQAAHNETSMELQERSVWTNHGCLDSGRQGDIRLRIAADAKIGGVYHGETSWSLSPSATLPTMTHHYRATIKTNIDVTTTSYQTLARTCDGSRYPQACMHYSSVSRVYQYNPNFQRPTCANRDQSTTGRPLVAEFNLDHNTEWLKYIAKSYVNPEGAATKVRCQRDEWPPAHFMQGRPIGYIRVLPGGQNMGIPNHGAGGWKSFCKYPPERRVKTEGGPVRYVGNTVYVTSYVSHIVTLRVMDYHFTNMSPPAGDPDGLRNNPCWPSVLTNDPGFALLLRDDYYLHHPARSRYLYANTPAPFVTRGKSQPNFKRDLVLHEGDDAEPLFLVVEGNSTRRATEEEIEEDFGYQKCETEDCSQELEALRDFQVAYNLPTVNVSPDLAPATVTTTASVGPVTMSTRARPVGTATATHYHL